MGSYSIKDLERLINVKAHTIRMWEKRYAIVDPDRTKTNIRNYTDNDLKRLLNISILNRHGLKISKIAGLSNDELNQKVIEIVAPGSDLSQIESLVAAMIELNEGRFEQILSQNILKMGFEETLYRVIYPFFERIGLLWQTGTVSPAQEHFISNLIRMKLCVAIDGLPIVQNSEARRIILFLPEWELHEIGLLTYYYLARRHGFKVFYLGQSIPTGDLAHVIRSIDPHLIATYFVSAVGAEKLEKYIIELSSLFALSTLLISGMQTQTIRFALPPNVQILSSALEFRSILEALDN
ncbi:MAG: MerR family transcriptional regulator [Bacteroidales bacterium]|nr:MerR family transcriptional regulator [Bacteroidales bacterium]